MYSVGTLKLSKEGGTAVDLRVGKDGGGLLPFLAV